MKKISIILLCLMLLLCACGESKSNGGSKDTTVTVTDGSTASSGLSAADKKTLAETYIDKELSELIAQIGEPDSKDYAPSCLGDGEDGNLYYDGFIVYTYKTEDSEIIQFVE